MKKKIISGSLNAYCYKKSGITVTKFTTGEFQKYLVGDIWSSVWYNFMLILIEGYTGFEWEIDEAPYKNTFPVF